MGLLDGLLFPSEPLEKPLRDKWGHTFGSARQCETCGTSFRPINNGEKARRARFCCAKCASTARRGLLPAPIQRFITPKSDKALRIRSNGLVNKRRRLGWFTPPTACVACQRKCKLDGHHPDYTKPDEVMWLCRSCHLKFHQRPQDFAHIVPTKLDRQGPPPVPHGRGGRRGPTGKAKGRAMLVTIKGWTLLPASKMAEHLSCGHDFIREWDGRLRTQRRCTRCREAASHGTGSKAGDKPSITASDRYAKRYAPPARRPQIGGVR